MNFLAGLEKWSKPSKWGMGLVLLAVIGLLDFWTGNEIAFYLFYIIPVALVTWILGKGSGLFFSVLGSLIALLDEIATEQSFLHPLIYVWNGLVILGFFVIVTLLLDQLKHQLEFHKALAQTDSLTGAVSTRFFYRLLQIESDRFRRYRRPFTLAYFDLDNFKAINDSFGHNVGDTVLCTIVHETQRHLRKTDVIGRLGGDEFAMIFPETDQEGGQKVVQSIRCLLLDQMRMNGWPVTFSIGVATFLALPASQQEMIRMIDDLMYSAKKDGKDGIKSSVYTG